jgi:cytochrome c oxidase accessory protein FixG
MREQVCKYMCPYARFQSAMFDRDTMVVTYDAQRGDPRGTRARSADIKSLGLGECIDCSLCVQVCPTGIDIRKGLQYECIGCAACIDACDRVMDRMHYPRGLIRFATENGLAGSWSRAHMLRRAFRPRVLIYGTVLLAITAALAAGLALRSPFRVDIVRDRGALARLVDDGWIENVYRLQVMNATEQGQRYSVAVDGLPAARIAGGADERVDAAQSRWIAVSVRVPPEAAAALGTGAHGMHFRIEQHASDGLRAATVTEKSTFVVPR